MTIFALVKKLFLEVPPDYDFLLFGIVSEEKPHRLAWYLNNELQFDFARKDDLQMIFSDDEQLELTIYEYKDEMNRLDFFLVNNKEEDTSRYWIPELKNMDYFIVVKGAIEAFKKRKFIQQFKKTQGVRLITEFQLDKIKQKERLLF